MLEQLKPLLPMRNKIGYVAARNTRKLADVLTEYLSFKNQLIQKYGEPDKDSDGKELSTISIKFDSPNFKEFDNEFSEIKDIQHDVDIMTLKYDEVIGFLNGNEILTLEWMLED